MQTEELTQEQATLTRGESLVIAAFTSARVSSSDTAERFVDLLEYVRELEIKSPDENA